MSELSISIEFDSSDGADKTIYEIKRGSTLIATVYTQSDADLIVSAIEFGCVVNFLIGDV